MSGGTSLTYEATYRRAAFAAGVIVIVLIVAPAAVVWVFMAVADFDTRIAATFSIVGGAIAGLIATLLTQLRVHRWVIEPLGLRIEERPKVPFTGRLKSTFAAFGDIAALRRIEVGTDRLIEIQLRDGVAYRMAQAYGADANGLRSIPDAAGLNAFEAAILGGMTAAGVAAPAWREGLSFMNRAPGLAALGVMFAVSLAIAVLAAWGMWQEPPYGQRAAQGAGLALVLPVGAGYLIIKSVKRRIRVLRALRTQ
jgi:hypothetical protein